MYLPQKDGSLSCTRLFRESHARGGDQTKHPFIMWEAYQLPCMLLLLGASSSCHHQPLQYHFWLHHFHQHRYPNLWSPMRNLRFDNHYHQLPVWIKKNLIWFAIVCVSGKYYARQRSYSAWVKLGVAALWWCCPINVVLVNFLLTLLTMLASKLLIYLTWR